MSVRSLPQLIRNGEYERSWVRSDALAGLTVAAMLVPQAMAYAELAGLSPAAGFRASLVALPVYALFGTSRHLGVGPEPGTAVLAALAVAPLAAGDLDRYVALMAALAGLVGAITLLAGIARLGFVANLLSKPVLVGYISGVGFTLLSSQISAMTGITIDADRFFTRFAQLAGRLDQLDAATSTVGVCTLAAIMVARRFTPTIPGGLIALAGAGLVVRWSGLDVATVGTIDAALPSFAVPSVSGSDIASLLGPAAGLALIAYTDNILTARSISRGRHYDIDADRELIALGAMNATAAFAGGYPVSSSASRSIVPATLNSRTQLSSVVAFSTLILFLLFGKSVLAEIPRAALAAVVVAAAFAVIDFAGLRALGSISRIEAVLAGVTCLAVVTTDLLLGVLIAVALSVVIALGRVSRPHTSILGQAAGLDGWIDVEDDRTVTLDGLLVYRFDAPLFFANATYFGTQLRRMLDNNPGDERHVILDFEGVGSIDTTAAEELLKLVEELHADDVTISIARANKTALAVIDRSGLRTKLGDHSIYPTINAAVGAFNRDIRP